jgi:hypothetical protein
MASNRTGNEKSTNARGDMGSKRKIVRHQQDHGEQSAPQAGERNLLSYRRRASKADIQCSSRTKQEDVLAKICMANELGDPKSIITFVDEGASGTKFDRPQLERMMDFIAGHRGCILVVEDVERLFRDERTLLLVGARLLDGAVELYDRDGPIAYEVFIERGIAEFHSLKMIHKRTRFVREGRRS